MIWTNDYDKQSRQHDLPEIYPRSTVREIKPQVYYWTKDPNPRFPHRANIIKYTTYNTQGGEIVNTETNPGLKYHWHEETYITGPNGTESPYGGRLGPNNRVAVVEVTINGINPPLPITVIMSRYPYRATISYDGAQEEEINTDTGYLSFEPRTFNTARIEVYYTGPMDYATGIVFHISAVHIKQYKQIPQDKIIHLTVIRETDYTLRSIPAGELDLSLTVDTADILAEIDPTAPVDVFFNESVDGMDYPARLPQGAYFVDHSASNGDELNITLFDALAYLGGVLKNDRVPVLNLGGDAIIDLLNHSGARVEYVFLRLARDTPHLARDYELLEGDEIDRPLEDYAKMMGAYPMYSPDVPQPAYGVIPAMFPNKSRMLTTAYNGALSTGPVWRWIGNHRGATAYAPDYLKTFIDTQMYVWPHIVEDAPYNVVSEIEETTDGVTPQNPPKVFEVDLRTRGERAKSEKIVNEFIDYLPDNIRHCLICGPAYLMSCPVYEWSTMGAPWVDVGDIITIPEDPRNGGGSNLYLVTKVVHEYDGGLETTYRGYRADHVNETYDPDSY